MVGVPVVTSVPLAAVRLKLAPAASRGQGGQRAGAAGVGRGVGGGDGERGRPDGEAVARTDGGSLGRCLVKRTRRSACLGVLAGQNGIGWWRWPAGAEKLMFWALPGHRGR